MNVILSFLSIAWGLLIMIFFFIKLKDRDFQAYKAKQDVDEGFTYLVVANWILRKTPILAIKGVVVAVGLIFIVGGLVSLITNR